MRHFSTYKWEMFMQNTVFAELTYTTVAFAKVRCLATDPVWVQLVIFFQDRMAFSNSG